MTDGNEKSLEDIIAQAMKNKNASDNKENMTDEKSVDDLHKKELKFKYYEGEEEPDNHSDKHVRSRKKTSAKKKAMIIIGIILGILLAFLITAGIIIHHYISKLNLVDPSEKAEIVDSIDIDDLVSGPDSPKDRSIHLKAELRLI